MRALTLVELLVSVLILTVLMGGAVMVLIVADKANVSEMGYLDLQGSARQAMYTMVRELRGASDVVANGSTLTFNTPTTTDVRYYRCADSQVKRCIAEDCCSNQNGRYLGNNINSLAFSISGNTVDIQLAAQNIVRNRTACFPSPCSTPAKVLKEKVRIRNE